MFVNLTYVHFPEQLKNKHNKVHNLTLKKTLQFPLLYFGLILFFHCLLEMDDLSIILMYSCTAN